MKFKILIVSALSVIATSCKSNVNHSIDKNDSLITIVFKNLKPDINELKKATGQSMEYQIPKFSYFKNNQYYILKVDSTNVSNIKSLSEPILFSYKYHIVNKLNFIFYPGDSVIIDEKEQFPLVKITNRHALPYDYQFEARMIDKHSDLSGFTSINKYYFPFISLDFKRGNLKYQIEANRKLEYSNSMKYFKKYQWYLDSLLKENLISKDLANFFYLKNYYEKNAMKLIYGDLNKEQADEILSNKSFDSFPFQFVEKQNFINSYIHAFYEQKSTQIKQSNGSIFDSREVFDKVLDSKSLNNQERRIVLLKQLRLIADNFAKNDLMIYLNKYLTVFKDSSTKSFYKKNYLATLNDIDGIIYDSKNNQISLDSLIKVNKEKVIYFDLWASWCAPCREEMPNSLKLRKEYKSKPIIFIYLSIDKNLSNWLYANLKEGLSDYKYSYLIDQKSLKQGVLGKLKINTIPRYILLDQNGHIYQENAPSPSSSNIKVIFDQLLLKN